MHFQTKFGQRGRFYPTGAVSLPFVRSVNDLNMIGFMAGHHLVAGDAVEYGVHDRPLRRGFAPAALGFLQWQFDNFRDAEIAMKLSIHDEHSAPDNVAWFGNA